MATNIMPVFGNNFRVYIDDGYIAGIAEGTFPSIEFMSSEVKGSGLAGAIDMPAPGHFGSLTCTLNWRTITEDFALLGENHTHDIDMYAEHLDFDGGAGEYISRSVHVYMKALTKKIDQGKLVVAESVEAQTEHEIITMQLFIDNVEQLLIDKINYVYRANGVDYLATTRRSLGIM